MKSIKLKGIAAAVSGALLFGAAPFAMADTTDDLLKALRDKGVLSQDEFDTFNASRDIEKVKKAAGINVNFKDGIVIQSADKAHEVSFNGRVQLDYRHFAGGDIDRVTADTFDLRRAYLTMKGKMYNDYTWEVTWNATESKIDQAWFNIGWWDAANIKFGDFKMPMSIEEQTSSRFIDFQERSLVNKLVPGKEVGIMVNGTPLNGVYYALAVSNGEGGYINGGGTKAGFETNNTNDSPDVIGRVNVNLAKMMDVKNAVYHVGASFSNGHPSSTATPTFGAESKGYTAFSTAALAGNPERTRTGLEGILAYNNFKLQGEWLNYNLTGTSASGVGYDRDIDAWYVSANWLITGEQYADSYKTGGAFDRIKPKNDFVHPNATASGLGAWEAGLRYSKFDASDYKTTNATGTGVLDSGKANEIKSYTAQIKWILNPNLRWMLDYVRTDYNTPIVVSGVAISDHEDAVTTRFQFDF